MAEIVGIGACVADTLYRIPSFPKEDTKIKAITSKISGGGPVATGLVAAKKLGVNSAFIGVLSDDSNGIFLKNDFEKFGVDTTHLEVKSGFRSFTSSLWLCDDTATRTCVFDKGDLPGLELNEHQKEAIKKAKLLMVDGNELNSAVKAAKIAKENATTVLYDCGGVYNGVEELLKLTDIMIPSEEFALEFTKCKTTDDAAKKLFNQFNPKVVVITMGKKGGVLFDGNSLYKYPVYPADVVDSNGSGDVFHGAFAAGIVKGFDYLKCCHFSSAVSAIKCMGFGARESVPDFETVKKYLKENGYEL